MSKLEATLLFQMTAVKLPAPVREYRFHPPRRWRFDFAWPDHKIAAECEGLTLPWKKSRHTTNDGFTKDCEKYNAAVEDGWKVFRYPMKFIKSGAAVAQLERVFKSMEKAA